MADDSENTQPKRRGEHLAAYQFKTGNHGRPKGSRNKLGEAFIEALHDDFMENGVAAIQIVRNEKPDQYLKVIASLLPKEMTLNVNDDQGNLTDDEIVERIRELSKAISPFLTGGTGGVAEGVESTGSAKESSCVH
jgi:hypothetical protein